MFILPRGPLYPLFLGMLIAIFDEIYKYSDIYKQLLINLVKNDIDSPTPENAVFYYFVMLFAVIGTADLAVDAICFIQDKRREKQPAQEIEKDNPYEVRLAKIKYEELVPPEYTDPASKRIMYNPVYLISKETGLTLHGNAYELETAEDLLRSNDPRCYLTRVPCNAYRSAPELKQQIEQWVEEVEQRAFARSQLNATSLWKKAKPTSQNSNQNLSIAANRSTHLSI